MTIRRRVGGQGDNDNEVGPAEVDSVAGRSGRDRNARRRWRRGFVVPLVFAVILLSLGFVGMDAWAARDIATGCFKEGQIVQPPPGARDVDYGPAHAWFTSPSAGHPTIVMVHGYPGDRSDSAGFAAAMQRQGYGLLRIDLVCAHTHALYGGGPLEAGEVIDAVRFASQQTASSPVVLYGVSAGGTEVLLAADEGAQVIGVVADSAPTNIVNIADYWHLHGQRWAFHLTPRLYGLVSDDGHLADLEHDLHHRYVVPTLIIQGEADTNVNPADGPKLAQLTHGQLWMVPGANHMQSFQVEPGQYSKRVSDFFSSLGRGA